MSVRDAVRRAFVENAALKIVALLLSVTLFIVVHGDKDSVISFNLRVGYTEASDRVLVSPMVDEVRVTVKGPWTRVRRFDDRSVEPIHVDLSKLSDGDFTFQDDMIHLPPGLRVASVNPPSLRVRFESTGTKIVAVTPELAGEPARGFRIDRKVASPTHVLVRGPKSIVEAMTEVKTRQISVADKNASFQTRVELEPLEQHVTIVDAPPIDVDVQISEEPAQLGLAHVAVVVRPPPQSAVPLDPARVKIVPAVVDIVLRGGKNAIEGVDRRHIVPHVNLHAEDVGAAAREAEVLVEGVPAGVAVEVHPNVVTLTVVPPAQK